MTATETIIHGKWVIPVEPHDVVYENYAVVIKDGKIIETIDSAKALQKYTGQNHIHKSKHAILPGFINCHCHSPMSLLRGYADDLALMDWLQHYIWPAEKKWVSESFVFDGSCLAIAEMLRSGVTCFNDMYFFPHITAKAAVQTGMRSVIGLPIITFANPWASDEDDCFAKNVEIFNAFQQEPLLTFTMAPHSIYATSEAGIMRVAEFADQHNLPIHMHVHETDDEVQQSLQTTKQRPLARLHKMNITSSRLLAVHMTQVNEADHEIIAASGSHIIHCPSSNLKLASGFCPAQRFVQAGVNVAFGTDGAASNNNLDMLEELQLASILAKAVANEPTAIDAAQTLRMATYNGAQALGLGEMTGSLEVGKAADIIAIDLEQLESQPVYHPVSQIVYTASREQVTDVWVNGKHLLADRQLTTLDEHELIAKAKQWGDKIS